MFTAKEAQDQIKESYTAEIEAEWFELENEIEEAIQSKRFFITFYHLTDTNITRLKNLGYDVRCAQCEHSGVYWTISWGRLTGEEK